MFSKVLVIGCPGAGKTTFARALRDRTGLPLYYLDRLWHKPDKTTVSRDAFDAALTTILQSDRWILDGNYSRTLPRRLEACDTVFLFDLPVETCLTGALARIGTVREELPWVETELDPEFRAWIEAFPVEELPKTMALLEACRGKKEIHIFHSHAESDRFLRTLPPAAEPTTEE